MLAPRCVCRISARAACVPADIGKVKKSADVFAVVNDPEVDIVLELMGGIDVAKTAGAAGHRERQACGLLARTRR